MPEPINLLDIEIDTIKPSELINRLTSLIQKAGKPTRVLQINPEMMVSIYKNHYQHDLINSVDYVVPNGVGIQWAATYSNMKPSLLNLIKTLSWIILSPDRLHGQVTDRYNSSSFTAPLLHKLADLDQKVKILIAGSPKHSNIESTASMIRGLGTNLEVTSFDTSNFNDSKLRQLSKLALKNTPELIILAIGFPAQEQAAVLLKKTLNKGVILTEGGTFDYTLFGGKIKRANGFIQRIGLEWLWRLILEPTRLKRQASLLEYIKLIHKNHK